MTYKDATATSTGGPKQKKLVDTHISMFRSGDTMRCALAFFIKLSKEVLIDGL